MSAHMKFSVLLFLAIIFLYTLYPVTVRAAGSCSASVSPTSAETNSSATFNFTVTNTGDAGITYINIVRPLTSFNLFNTGGVPSPWEANITTSQAELYDSTLAPGSTLNFSIGANISSSEGESGNWTIETNAGSCSGGPFAVSITGASDTTAPTISEPSVSSVSDTSATISWTSDEPADSTLNYGTEYGVYTGSKYDATLKTSPSFTLTGLSANTTYYYEFKSADGSGNSTPFYDFYTFTTAKASSTTTTTTAATATATPTPASTSSTTPKVILDTTRPSVLLTSDFSEAFEQAPLIEGRATDNKGVTRVDYSIDDGKNWLPVDEVKSSKLKVKSSVEFEFTPFIFEDGNYSVKVRAFDASGNIGVSRTYTLVIDRLPPQVGGSIFSVGAQILPPTEEGYIFTLPGLAVKTTLSAVGGPTEIDIVSKLKSQNSKVKNAETMHSLVKNPDSGLWSGGLNFREAGVYTLLAKSIDGAENKTERKLNTFIVLPNGLVKNSTNGVIKDAVISIYYLEPTFKNFVLWDGMPYGQTNPQKTKEDGAYSFYLPPGKYYLQINASGYNNLKTNIFEIDKNLPITKDFTLEKSASLTFGPLTIPLPSFSQTDVTVDFKVGAIPSELQLESTVKGAQFPQFSSISENEQFSITDLFGKPTIITFLNSWSPLTSEQLSILSSLDTTNINSAVIIPQESASKVSLFQKRGRYNLTLLADPDGELVEPLGIHSLPTHIFLDRRGIITNTKVGVLREGELMDQLIN